MATPVRTKDITEEEYLALGEDVNAEVIDGELFIMSPNKAVHGVIGSRISSLLSAFVASRKLGRILADGTAYVLRKEGKNILKDSLVPDVSYLNYARFPEDAELDVLLTLAPNLAVEVISQTEDVVDIDLKIRKYLERGTEQVWLMYPAEWQVRVCTPEQPTGVLLKAEDTLSGGATLPHFAVPVGVIFDEHDHEAYAQTLQKLLSISQR